MYIFDEKYFKLILEIMDQGILKNIFLTSSYQIPKNFPNKLKTILDYLFQTKHFVDISFETILPLLKTDGTIVLAYHHVYIKHNKKPLVPQQKPEWEMTHQNDFPLYFNRYRDFHNFDFRNKRNKQFYLIKETQTMSIWITEPLDQILNLKIFVTSEEQNFINHIWADSP